MVSPFGLIRTPKILFGPGTLNSLPGILRNQGSNVLVITGSASFMNIKDIGDLISALMMEQLTLFHERIDKEPTTEMIDNITDRYRDLQLHAVLAVGGGSVLDTGKAVSAMLPLKSQVREYLEGVGTKTHPGIRKFFVAVPTTSGTGSEVTSNAVISGNDSGKGFNRALRHENLVPDIAVVDPALTLNCPPHITAASGMDAFTQLIESYLSVKSGPITDALALDGIRHVHLSLSDAFRNGDPGARSGMSYAALLSGITLANAGLGLTHGFASSLGGAFDIPHGTICATLMGTVNRHNINYLLENNIRDVATEKYTHLGTLLSGIRGKQTSWYLRFTSDYLDKLTDQLKINRLGLYGVTMPDLEKIASATDHKSNPVRFGKEQLADMLKERL